MRVPLARRWRSIAPVCLLLLVPGALVARLPAQAEPEALPAAAPAWRLVVKFQDALRVRAAPDGRARAQGVHALGALDALAAREGLRFRPLLDLSEARLEHLAASAVARSGRAQPDLAGFAVVEGTGPDAARQGALAAALRALPEVELAWLEPLFLPPPGDLVPTTPSHGALQGYLAPEPGLDASWTRAQGHRGEGVRLSDCEYGWNAAHEDLADVDLHLEPGQTVHPGVYGYGWQQHGTAVVGAAAAPDNGYGVTGIADRAEVHTYPEWTIQQGPRRHAAIAAALADSAPGDVVLLEMQTLGPTMGYAPAEYDPAVFALVRAGVDAGVIVVAAAGNGNQDLDAPAYDAWRAQGDSGAIFVGAGAPDASHARLSFSNHGSRVDVQGWGSGVFTLGYGTYAQYGGDPNQGYTATFNGTSSASALVAAACAALQSAAQQTTGARLSPRAMRRLLVTTGRATADGASIGPHPDLRAALDALPTLVVADFRVLGAAGPTPHAVQLVDQSFGAGLSRVWDFGDGTTSTERDPLHVYAQPGVYDVRLEVSGAAGADALVRAGAVVVAPGLGLQAVAPAAIPALLPGSERAVVVTGSGLDQVTSVALDGVPLAPGRWEALGTTALRLDPPQLGWLGAHELSVVSPLGTVALEVTTVEPASPALQVGSGDALLANTLHASAGAPFLLGGRAGETHWVLVSSQAEPSEVPGLVSLAIGAGFSALDLVRTAAIGSAGWSAFDVPFPPLFATAYFQSVTFDQGRPLAVSNLQSALLAP